MTDSYPNEIRWDIVDEATESVASGVISSQYMTHMEMACNHLDTTEYRQMVL